VRISDEIRKSIFKGLHISFDRLPDLEKLKISEWSKDFENLMRNRLLIGAFRYGRLRQENKPIYDRSNDIINRIKLYKEDGNLEHLVDCANLCMMEFEEGNHPKKHFKANDDSIHTEEI